MYGSLHYCFMLNYREKWLAINKSIGKLSENSVSLRFIFYC